MPKAKKRKRSILAPILALLLVLALAGTLLFSTFRDKIEHWEYPQRFTEYVEYYAGKYGIDPMILYAFIRTESNFDPNADSDAGARGLMQITEVTFDWIKMKIAPKESLTFDDLYDPETNIRFGSYFVSYCLDRYSGHLATAAAAYHSGVGTVDGLLGQEAYSTDGVTLDHYPYPQMRLYVKKITESYQHYSEIYKYFLERILEMKTTEELKNLLYKNETVADAAPNAIAAAQDFCEGYKTFLDNAKTEREATAYSEKLLTAVGYQKFVPGTSYAPGTKVYTINREKCVLAATIGTKNLEEGFHLNIAHIDSPRLDLRPVPVFEKTGIGYLRTHYYGGVRKYQWPTIPLALHGVIYRADGTRVNVCIGEKDDDPVFCITDLLPHLGAKQSAKTLAEGITAEDLNVIIASLPIEDKDAEQRVKLNVLGMLNEAYGITERDFTRAEIEIVPAYKARDIGLDRAMIGAYGHDDRVDAYPALMAEIGTKSPAYTSVCVLTDKEETGSDGVTGLNSMYTFHFLQQLCAGQGADYITACKAAKCLSADVTAAYDPTFADAFEPDNGTYAGRGVAIYKYTGSRGKSGTSDASAELVSYLTGLMDANSVVWQIGEMGKLDLGGGGTVAKYVANQDIDTIDIGVPVLSMHSPFEIVSKADVYMAYLTFKAFCEDAE